MDSPLLSLLVLLIYSFACSWVMARQMSTEWAKNSSRWLVVMLIGITVWTVGLTLIMRIGLLRGVGLS